MTGFVFESKFGEGFAGDCSEKTENDLFGLKELTTQKVEESVKRYVP